MSISFTVDYRSMKQAINSIRNIVNDMKKQVNETNAAAQYEINRKAEFLAACAVPETPALKLPNTQEEVVTCRSEEDPLYKAYELCVSEKARCSNTTACCASLVQPNKYCLNPGVAPSPLQYEAQCDGTSSCKETDIKEKIAFFKGKLDALDAAEKACEDSRAGCQDSYDCVPKQDSWKELANGNILPQDITLLRAAHISPNANLEEQMSKCREELH
ncbi:hypothetical protein AK812_SmicGene28265 [Symbiodinium microadriaticum]|uniref:Uncharacterized protein n=1 Tax=Symbiodinium microadriaticum TaxID=2951 RepID=A0A1Q9D4U0_SYMMI|nr:hypothetical protein AK812_SmicGene28265 [Symbiodinium microadriaticum]